LVACRCIHMRPTARRTKRSYRHLHAEKTGGCFGRCQCSPVAAAKEAPSKTGEALGEAASRCAGFLTTPPGGSSVFAAEALVVPLQTPCQGGGVQRCNECSSCLS